MKREQRKKTNKKDVGKGWKACIKVILCVWVCVCVLCVCTHRSTWADNVPPKVQRLTKLPVPSIANLPSIVGHGFAWTPMMVSHGHIQQYKPLPLPLVALRT